MNEQSDTPRTDAASYIATDYDDVVSMDFARDLERETVALRAEVERLRDALRNLLIMLPHCDTHAVSSQTRIPFGFCYVRWIDIAEGHAALAGTEAKL